LIVVTIMGTAAAVVVPNMLQGGTLGVQAGARTIIADIQFAQNEAMAQNSVRRVLFDTADNSYTVQLWDPDSGSTGAWVAEHNQVIGGVGTENFIVDFDDDSRFRGIQITSADFGGNAWVEFDDLGNPSSGGTVRVEFNQHKYDISLAPFTGRVTVALVEP